ncbi:hypothetical protein D8V62_23770 [Salmonella enterica]|nr:hypothetical protein [Salmonella enterica]
MSEYRKDPPPQELLDMLFTKDGNLYWKPEYCGKRRIEGKPIGTVDRCGYLIFTSKIGQENKHCRCYKVHRVIFLLEKGEWPPICDHKDGNKLNNHPDNLRSSDTQKNMFNKRVSKKNKSGYVGVFVRRKNYKIAINIDGKRFEMFSYPTAETAALARDLLAHWFYGEHASFNILDKKAIKVNGLTY